MTTLVKRPVIIFWAILTMSTLLGPVAFGSELERDDSFHVSSAEWTETADDFVLAIKGATPPTYTMYELFDPFRVIVDIADASIDQSLNLSQDLPKGPVSKINGSVLEDKEPFIARIEFFIGEDDSYTIDRQDNSIIAKFTKSPAETTDTEATNSEGIQGEVIPAEEAEESIPESETIPTKPATVLFDIEVDHSATETKVFFRANGVINDYEKVELTKNNDANRPDRIYFDIKNVNLAGPIPPKTVGTALAQIRSAVRSDGTRIVLDSSLDHLFDYKVEEQADGLLVTIIEPSAATSVLAGLLDSDSSTMEEDPPVSPEPEIIPATNTEETATNEMQDAAEEEPADSIAAEPKKTSRQKETGSALAFAGYTRQRITVDFYKIDIHNVFRLFGEISNLNMVVAQGVGGSLTLALNDVPWDFAMDIILNLKDLQKEERYNTIVISPKSKKFEWPERTLETVEFKEDESFDFTNQAEESLKISQRQEIPETIVQAKTIIHQAQNLEKLGNYTAALAQYEEAFLKWPENIIIAKRIAALCLVRLGQNAKAVHYAKVAMKADPNDLDSALKAAIGLARMKQTETAEEYFEKAVSGSPPSSAALASYAAFSEEQQQYPRALTLLKKHEDIHGDSLATMISKARIQDKQGQRDLASSTYQAILLSGYEIPADLSRYINGRASLANQ